LIILPSIPVAKIIFFELIPPFVFVTPIAETGCPKLNVLDRTIGF
jgi:hypothetical protein